MVKTNSSQKPISELRLAAVNAHQGDNLDQAEKFYRLYLLSKPKDAAIWSNLGALFRKQKRYKLAAAAQTRALELSPDTPSLINNASNAFYDVGDLSNALKLRLKALKHEPENHEHYANIGKYYRGLHQLDKAQEVLSKGIKKFPEAAELHIQSAFVELAQGNYSKGFETFNWRWQGDELTLPEFSFPKWHGENLNGKTILIIAEQGYGDTILMARFLPILKARGCTLKMRVKPQLRRLFTGLQSDVTFIEHEPDLQDCNYWAPMMDLPLYLNASLQTLPKPPPLSIPEDAKARARKIVAPFHDRFKLGIMWSGSTTYRANHKRSFNHQRFLEFSDIPKLQMFSLYKGKLLDDFVNDGTSTFIVNAAGNDRDFSDSAAIMQNLDLVISVDSAIVHLAGSMGIEVWNLLHSEAYWLYEPYPDHTPWYPSMRLIRQDKPGNWDNVFTTLKKDISARVMEWKKNG